MLLEDTKLEVIKKKDCFRGVYVVFSYYPIFFLKF